MHSRGRSTLSTGTSSLQKYIGREVFIAGIYDTELKLNSYSPPKSCSIEFLPLG